MNLLLAGTLNEADGSVNPAPVVCTVAPDGTVTDWRPMGAMEPHSTYFRPSLLALPSLRIID